MLLDDVGDYLSSGGLGTVGTDIFKGWMPDAPPAAIAIYETGGRAPDHSMASTAGAAVAVEWPRVQVVCRADSFDYDAARTKAHSVFKLLDGLPPRAINGVSYLWGAAVQSPFLLDRDADGRVSIACNYDIAKRQSP